MSTEDDYGQGVDIAALLDAPDAEALAQAIANGSLSRSVLRFDSAAARAAALPAPTDGMVSTLTDTKRVYRYNGSAWVAFAPQFQLGIFLVTFNAQDQYPTTINFPTAFPTTPFVFVNLASAAGGTSRWTPRVTSASPTQFSALFQSGTDGAVANWLNVPIWWLAVAV